MVSEWHEPESKALLKEKSLEGGQGVIVIDLDQMPDQLQPDLPQICRHVLAFLLPYGQHGLKNECIYGEPENKAPSKDMEMPEAKPLQLVPCLPSKQQKVTEKPVVKSVSEDLKKTTQARKKEQEVDKPKVEDGAKKTESKKNTAKNKTVGKEKKRKEESQGEQMIQKKKPKAVKSDEPENKEPSDEMVFNCFLEELKMIACKEEQEVDKPKVEDGSKKTESKKNAAKNKTVGKEKKRKEESQGEQTIQKKKPKAVKAAEKTSKQKGKVIEKKKKRKGETPQLTAEELAALVARVDLPEWFSCKKALALYFPEDTEKRFTSRCYHKTLDVEKKAGKSLEEGKSLARVMHQHAKVQWNILFPEE